MGRRKAQLLWEQPTKSCHSWSNNLALCLWQSYTSLHQVFGNFKNIIHLYHKIINHWTFGGAHKSPYSDLKVHLKQHHLLYQFIHFRLIVQRRCIFKHRPIKIREGFSNMTETTVPLHCEHWRQLSDTVLWCSHYMVCLIKSEMIQYMVAFVFFCPYGKIYVWIIGKKKKIQFHQLLGPEH